VKVCRQKLWAHKIVLKKRIMLTRKNPWEKAGDLDFGLQFQKLMAD
jgi:hypothetical protein